jgi:hypothetical protein
MSRINYLRVVTVDGEQIAPAPRRRSRGAAHRKEREVLLAIIAEHLGHVEYSVNRIRTLTKELEVNLGISLPPIPIVPRPDFPDGRPNLPL